PPVAGHPQPPAHDRQRHLPNGRPPRRTVRRRRPPPQVPPPLLPHLARQRRRRRRPHGTQRLVITPDPPPLPPQPRQPPGPPHLRPHHGGLKTIHDEAPAHPAPGLRPGSTPGPPRRCWRLRSLVLSRPGQLCRVTGGTLPRTRAGECSRSRNVSFRCCTTPPIPSWRLSRPSHSPSRHGSR